MVIQSIVVHNSLVERSDEVIRGSVERIKHIIGNTPSEESLGIDDGRAFAGGFFLVSKKRRCYHFQVKLLHRGISIVR